MEPVPLKSGENGIFAAGTPFDINLLPKCRPAN